jgi:hypothetical protein
MTKKRRYIGVNSLIALVDINFGEIALAGDLHVIRSSDEVHALESPSWEGPGAATRLGAPCDLLTLGVADGTRRWWSPEAEVIDVAVQKINI